MTASVTSATAGGSAGGGSSNGGIPPEHVYAYIDARVGQVKAELINHVDDKMRPIEDRLKKLPGWGGIWAIIGTIGGAFLAAVGLIVSVLAFGGSRFDGGMSTRGVVAATMAEQHKRDDAQDQKLDEILRRLPPAKASNR